MRSRRRGTCDPNEHRFETTLPDAEKRFWFRLLTGADERKLPQLRRGAGDRLLSCVGGSTAARGWGKHGRGAGDADLRPGLVPRAHRPATQPRSDGDREGPETEVGRHDEKLGIGFVFTARDLASGKMQRLESRFTSLDDRVSGGADRMNTAFRQLGIGLAVFTAGAAAVAGALSLAKAAGQFEHQPPLGAGNGHRMRVTQNDGLQLPPILPVSTVSRHRLPCRAAPDRALAGPRRYAPSAAAGAPSRISRTRSTSVFGMNGFRRSRWPDSSTPCRLASSSV